jgi:hypothetical protein
MLPKPTNQAPTSAQLRTSNEPTRTTNKYATLRLTSDQQTFTTGDDNPLNGGDAKGLCNLWPETPAIKWGSALAKNAPLKKYPT